MIDIFQADNVVYFTKFCFMQKGVTVWISGKAVDEHVYVDYLAFNLPGWEFGNFRFFYNNRLYKLPDDCVWAGPTHRGEYWEVTIHTTVDFCN